MEVYDRGVTSCAKRAELKLASDRGERIIESVHEDSAKYVDDEKPRPLRITNHRGAPSRRAGREIHRTDQAGLALDEYKRFSLIEGVIAKRYRVDANGKEILEYGFGEPESSPRVFAIDDDEIELPPGAQQGNLLKNGVAT